MKAFRILCLLVVFVGCALAGLKAGRQFNVHARPPRTPAPEQSLRPAFEVKSVQNELADSKPQPQVLLPTQASLPIASPTQTALPLAQPTQEAPDPSVEPLAQPAVKPIRQNNILLIGVDDLEAAKPRLEGAWLVLYLAQSPRFTFMPVYPGIPAEDGKVTSQDGALAKKFQSDPSGAPGPAFFSELKAKGLWWSGYFVVDRYALAEIVDLFNSIAGEDGATLTGSARVEVVPLTWKNPQRAKQEQARLARGLCSVAAHLSVDHISELDDLFLLFSHHVLSDIDREQTAAELVGLLIQGGRVTCEFPSMDMSSLSP
jgi:hypothetical protein